MKIGTLWYEMRIYWWLNGDSRLKDVVQQKCVLHDTTSQARYYNPLMISMIRWRIKWFKSVDAVVGRAKVPLLIINRHEGVSKGVGGVWLTYGVPFLTIKAFQCIHNGGSASASTSLSPVITVYYVCNHRWCQLTNSWSFTPNIDIGNILVGLNVGWIDEIAPSGVDSIDPRG
jgi:hypothetical protein